MVVLTVGNACGPFKQSFRETREGYFNMSLEKLAGQPEDHAPDLKKGLEPIHEVLKSYPFVTGNQGKTKKICDILHVLLTNYLLSSWLG